MKDGSINKILQFVSMEKFLFLIINKYQIINTFLATEDYVAKK